MTPKFFSTNEEVIAAVEQSPANGGPQVYILGLSEDLFEVGVLSADGRVPMQTRTSREEADTCAEALAETLTT